MNDINTGNKNNFEEKHGQLMICHGYGGLLYKYVVKLGGGSDVEKEETGRQEKDIYKKIYRTQLWAFGHHICPKNIEY
jgi:hypothetical protein